MENSDKPVTITVFHKEKKYIGILHKYFIEYNNEKYTSIKSFCDFITDNKTSEKIFKTIMIGECDYNIIRSNFGSYNGQKKLCAIYEYNVYGKLPSYIHNNFDEHVINDTQNSIENNDFLTALEPLSKYMENLDTFSINHKLEIIKKLSTMITNISGI